MLNRDRLSLCVFRERVWGIIISYIGREKKFIMKRGGNYRNYADLIMMFQLFSSHPLKTHKEPVPGYFDALLLYSSHFLSLTWVINALYTRIHKFKGEKVTVDSNATQASKRLYSGAVAAFTSASDNKQRHWQINWSGSPMLHDSLSESWIYRETYSTEEL